MGRANGMGNRSLVPFLSLRAIDNLARARSLSLAITATSIGAWETCVQVWNDGEQNVSSSTPPPPPPPRYDVENVGLSMLEIL